MDGIWCATGEDDTIDPDDVELTWAPVSRIPEDLLEKLPTPGAFRGYTVYGPEVKVADDAPPQHRLLGYLGRDPDWTAPPPRGEA